MTANTNVTVETAVRSKTEVGKKDVEVIENGETEIEEFEEQEIKNVSEPKISKNLQKWLIRLAGLVAIILVVLIISWFMNRPVKVDVIQPTQTTITETIASSGRVGGTTETNVGAQSPGIVSQLFVKEGDEVIRGQQVAIIKNDVAEAQVSQARAALTTAMAQLTQVSRGALSSDVDAALQQVRQAQAQVEQQRAAIIQAEKSVQQARSQLAQLEAERDLAKKNLGRSANLVKDGIVPRIDYDQAATNAQVAEKRVESQQRAIELAESSVTAARANLKSAQANVNTQQARLRTIQTGARPEDIQVARQRVAEAERALQTAEQSAGNAAVIAPFSGTVTKINTEIGQTVGAQGVLSLVSSQLEIRLNVDENNLSVLSVGQDAVISSSTFKDSSFRGTVTELGAAVDQARGTIEVKVVPNESPEWLRPGQTVNVNIITAKNATRLLVPQSAVIRSGDRTVVYTIEDGVAVEKIVVTRPPTDEGVPIIAGLEPNDTIIKNTEKIAAGDNVAAK